LRNMRRFAPRAARIEWGMMCITVLLLPLWLFALFDDYRRVIGLTLTAGVLIALLVRSAMLEVAIGDETIRVRNLFRTYTVARRDVGDIIPAWFAIFMFIPGNLSGIEFAGLRVSGRRTRIIASVTMYRASEFKQWSDLPRTTETAM
jgi:hypothetical protein